MVISVHAVSGTCAWACPARIVARCMLVTTLAFVNGNHPQCCCCGSS